MLISIFLSIAIKVSYFTMVPYFKRIFSELIGVFQKGKASILLPNILCNNADV